MDICGTMVHCVGLCPRLSAAGQVDTVAINASGDWLAFGSAKLGQLLVWEWQSETYVLKQQVSHHPDMTSCNPAQPSCNTTSTSCNAAQHRATRHKLVPHHPNIVQHRIIVLKHQVRRTRVRRLPLQSPTSSL